MTTTYTAKDVTADLGALLSLTGLFGLDAEGFWIDNGTKERYVYKHEGADEGKEIVAFQDPLPKGDYHYFNPFSESLGRKSVASVLFYRSARMMFNSTIKYAIGLLSEELLKIKEDKDYKANHAIVRMGAHPIDKKTTLIDAIDKKMVTDIDSLLKRTGDDLFVFPYLIDKRTSKLLCDALTDPKWDAKYGEGIPKKTLAAFKALILAILGLADVSELDTLKVKYSTENKSSAQLYTSVSLFIEVYDRFNDILPDHLSINLGELTEVVDRFPLAWAIAKHMLQPSVPRQAATSTATSDTSGFSQNQGGDRFRPLQDGAITNSRFTPLQDGSTGSSRFRPLSPSTSGGFFNGNGGGTPPWETAPAPSGFVGIQNQPMSGGFFNQQMAPMQGGGFFSGMGGGFSGGLDYSAPSNFGSGVTTRYFP